MYMNPTSWYPGQKRVMQFRMCRGSQLTAKRNRTRARDLASLSSFPKQRLGSVWLAVTYGKLKNMISVEKCSIHTVFDLPGTRRRWSHLFVELLVDHVENLNIDGEHQQQRGQHPAKEIEVDHVVHTDDGLKLTDHQGVIFQAAIFTKLLQVIPSKHRSETHYDGHQPTQ